MLALCLLFLLSGVSVGTFEKAAFEKAQNFIYHWKLVDYNRHGNALSHDYTTLPHSPTQCHEPCSLEGAYASSASHGLLEFNATGKYAGSDMSIHMEADVMNGFFTVWLNGDFTKRFFTDALGRARIPRAIAHIFGGAEINECFALKVEIDRNFVEGFMKHEELKKEHAVERMEHMHEEKCSVDGVEGRQMGPACVRENYDVMSIMLGHAFFKFSTYHEWDGPLDRRPKCANVVHNARLLAPALQSMVESLPDSDYKTGAQNLIVHMAGSEEQTSGGLSIPTFVGMLAGVSIISMIAGFALAHRSQVRNMDSYEGLNE